MSKKTPFRRMLKCFASLFPTDYCRKDFDLLMSVVKEKERVAKKQLYNHDLFKYPKILHDIEKRGYYIDTEDLKIYLQKYCLR
jgi:hypothetical protein